MEFELIINLISCHNDSSILLTHQYKPKSVLFLYRNKDLDILKSIEDYYTNLPCTFLKENIDNKSIDELENLILKYKKNNALFNLTSENVLDVLIFYTLSLKNNICCKFLDIKNKQIINMSLDDITIKKENIYDLNVEEIIKSIGGSIAIDSENSFNEEIINKMTFIIANNLETWEKYRVRLTDSNLFIHNSFNPEMLEINTTYLNNDEIILINKCIHFLEVNNQITYTQKGDCIEIKFLNEYIKGFIFKSGTWFEIFTKLIIKEIKNIDDVKSGVVFFWSKEKENVKNELDVVAVKDSVLICISCKDSKKYDEVALNELNIYANQLGGANVKKILVATMEPSKSIVINRAKEMGISIVVYNGNRNKFKNDLQNIICKQ
ncbi:Card1-like endonuclease domain-containing protein [Sarcina ventriculi]|uniref:Card1-like endonuclease domain-containing protein n=1 Tax=Sarcina ventriculi TaxID=1267 RepID=UPI00073E22E3|nr:DUF1887 family CARF protein [Sarcina ventriculi]